MEFTKTSVYGFEEAIRAMRNPLESWEKSDSGDVLLNEDDVSFGYVPNTEYQIGKNDLKLMQSLVKAGSDHRKFLRQIAVWVDITAPRFWFTEFDTYKIGTTANSTSTMHTIHKKEFTIDDFELSSETTEECDYLIAEILERLNFLRLWYLDKKDKRYWRAMIELLPQSYKNTRTVSLNYEVILNMYHQRKNHKLTEWSKDFVEWVQTLPYAEELIIGG